MLKQQIGGGFSFFESKEKKQKQRLEEAQKLEELKRLEEAQKLEELKRLEEAQKLEEEQRLKDEDAIIIKKINESILHAYYLSEILREKEYYISRKNIILAAVKKYGPLYNSFNHNFKNDMDVIKAAVLYNEKNLINKSRNIDSDKEIAKLAFNIDYMGNDILKYLSYSLKDDPEIVKLSIINYPDSLQYASDRLKDDPEIVKFSININPDSLQYASQRLKDDPTIVKIATDRIYRLFKNKSNINLIKIYNNLFRYLPDEIIKNIKESLEYKEIMK
jgi:hypothetical protein